MVNGPEDLTRNLRHATQDEYHELDHAFGDLGAVLADLRMYASSAYRGTMHRGFLLTAIDTMRDDADRLLRWCANRHVNGNFPAATCTAATVLVRSHMDRVRKLVKSRPF